MRPFLIATLSVLAVLAGPASADERAPSGGGHPGGGNINVNVNASASAAASGYAGAGASINARAYDVGAIRGGGGYGGAIVSGGGYGGWDSLGHGGGAGAVVVSGPGYGPSRPFGYTVGGFGRRYVTIDRCGSCGAPPPPVCDSRCDRGDDGRGNRYSDRQHDRDHDRRDCGCGGRYVAQPYFAAPLEPVDYREDYHDEGYREAYAANAYSAERYERRSYESRSYSARYEAEAYGETAEQGGYAPGYADTSQPYDGPYDPLPYAPPEPVYTPAEVPVFDQGPPGYYGDLPPGDDGVSMPYRQEPGERG